MKDSKTYRIRTKLGSESDNVINVQLNQTFDTFEILSLKLDQKNAYKLYESDYGVIVGRVIANGGFGVPNAKVSIFIESEEDDDFSKRLLYSYKSTMATNFDGVRYNLLPDYVDDACHQNVGTFPNKRLVLDNNDIIDIFDKYYVYTTVTNNAGDYMIFGVPTGSQKLHVDLDLSDIGMLSQRPRDLMYKGYTASDFESPNKFKKSTNLNSLAQIYSEDRGLYVYPFWGDTTDGADNIAVTRCDVELSYKFEPTCVFMGSIVTDTGSNSISKNCAGATGSGKMSELVSGEGTIEMIRKTVDNKTESFQIRGNRLIDGDGVWCYQIPMNLDYIMTDEFGNIVPSDNIEKGIPTRSRVRFRISLDKVPNDNTARNRCQYLVPNNPRLDEERYPDFTKTKEVDYEFGTRTKDENYRDLFWNKVYTVKNYIPRLQKNTWVKNRKHTGIKLINHFGDNNPMPYNNMNIKLTFQYRLICVIAKIFINLIRFLNQLLTIIAVIPCVIAGIFKGICKAIRKLYGIPIIGKLAKWVGKIPCTLYDAAMSAVPSCIEISSDFCGDNTTHNLTFYPGCGKIMFTNTNYPKIVGISISGCIQEKTKSNHTKKEKDLPQEEKTEASFSTTELYNCVESSLAEDNDVVSFNFHNDWVNGVLYAPLWFRKITPKKRLLFGLIRRRAKDQWCSSEALQNKKLKVFTPCAVGRSAKYRYDSFDGVKKTAYHMDKNITCGKDLENQNCLNRRGYIGLHNGVIVKRQTILGEDVYYYQAAEFDSDTRTGNMAIEGTPVKEEGQNGSVKLLFATDIVLLGSLNDCDLQGVPQFFKSLESSTYRIPPTLLFTDNVMVTKIDEDGTVSSVGTDDGETTEITVQESKTEMTGADWGNMNEDLCPGGRKEEKSQDSGLFYSIGCNSQRTLPKSCINLSRICEFGVSLDEAKYILSGSPTENGSDDNFYDYLVPDGFISKDELYNVDERSAFASLNINGLHTKLSEETGLMEYDFDYLLAENFDNSLRGVMEKRQKSCGNSYKYNYFLEEFSEGYYDFRMGKKPYFYDDEDYNQNMEKKRQPSGRTLPRYENSFYFYFGLKHGKTAIDKFNSQFFSNCYDEDEEFDNINITAVGNDWCSDLVPSDRNGYVAFDFSLLDLPCEVIIKSLSSNDFDDLVFETSDDKFYFSNWSLERLNRMMSPELENLRKALEELEAKGYVHKSSTGISGTSGSTIKMLPNGNYEVTITDKNGEIFVTTFEIKAEFLKSNVVGTNFNYADNVLLKRFNGNRNNIMTDTQEIEPSPITINSTREIGGTIAVSFPFIYNKISGENEEVEYFSIEVNGIKDPNGEYTYNATFERRASIEQSVHVIAKNENKNSQEIGVVLFGLPKADECYIIKVTQLCKVKGENNIWTYTPSGNVVTYTVCIKEKQPFKLYINDVDYDLISDWHCGFKISSKNGTSVENSGSPSDNWIHMSDKSRYRWYNYIPYQKLDQQMTQVTDQIINLFKNARMAGDTTLGISEDAFLGYFSNSNYQTLYIQHRDDNLPHVLYNIVEKVENDDVIEDEDDINKRSKFWQINTDTFRTEIDNLISILNSNSISGATITYNSEVYVHKTLDKTLTPEQYNALYDTNMYEYPSSRIISDYDRNSLPEAEKDKCTKNEFDTYIYEGTIISQEQYDILSEEEKEKYTKYLYDTYTYVTTIVINQEQYNELSEEEKTNCQLIDAEIKSDYYGLSLNEEEYNALPEDKKAYFTQTINYPEDYTENPLISPLNNLKELSEEVDELQQEVIDNVKSTFQLNCDGSPNTIIYKAYTDDMPVTYHEVHKGEQMEEANEFQTVECDFKYSNSYTIDNITIPTITTKDSKYFGEEDEPDQLNMRKFVGNMYNTSGTYNYSGTEKHDQLMIAVDNRSSCSEENKKKKSYFVAVNNARYDVNPNKEGNTIPERYRTGDGSLGNFFGFHIIDKIFSLNRLVWSVTDHVPYFLKLVDIPGSPEGKTPADREIHINERVYMNGLFTGTIRNGNAKDYDDYMAYVSENHVNKEDGTTITPDAYEVLTDEQKENYYALEIDEDTYNSITNDDVKEKFSNDNDRKRTYFQEEQIGNVFDVEIYTYRDNGETDESVEDRMPTMRYITGGILPEAISDPTDDGDDTLLNMKNYEKYAIGIEDNKPVQDSDMWIHTEKKEYCQLTKFDEYLSLKDDNDCDLSDNIDSNLKIVLSQNSVNNCQKREDTKFGLSIQNCSDDEGLIYYVFDAIDDNKVYYPLNVAKKNDDGVYKLDVGCEGQYSADKDKKFDKNIDKLKYLFNVYSKRSLKPYLAHFPNLVGIAGKIGNYTTTDKVKSVYENEKTEKEYETSGWSGTGEFTLNSDDYMSIYSVAITGNNTRTISPVYDYRYVCVTLLFGPVYTKNEILDEENAITGYDFTKTGKMTFDVSNIYNCKYNGFDGEYNNILYYFYNYPYQVSFECKIDDVNTVQGSYEHTSYVDDPEGYVLFDMTDEAYEALEGVYRGSNGKVGKTIKKNTKLELVDVTGLKHIPNWTGKKHYESDNNCCLAYEKSCWASVMWITNGGIWQETTEEDGSFLIDAFTEEENGVKENGYWDTDSDFTKVFKEGDKYKVGDVGKISKDTGEGSALCPTEEAEGGFLGWSTTPDGLNPIDSDTEIEINCADENGNGAQIYYAIWADDIVGIQWLGCDNEVIKKECNVVKGTVITAEDFPQQSNNDSVTIKGWKVTSSGTTQDFEGEYIVDGDTTFTAICSRAFKPSLRFVNCVDIGRHRIMNIKLSYIVTDENGNVVENVRTNWATRGIVSPENTAGSNEDYFTATKAYPEEYTVDFYIEKVEAEDYCVVYGEGCGESGGMANLCQWANEICGDIFTQGEGNLQSVKLQQKIVLTTGEDCSCSEQFTVRWLTCQTGEVHKTDNYVCKNDLAIPPSVEPEREGYIFDGWDYDNTPITSDLDICAKWKTDEPSECRNISVRFRNMFFNCATQGVAIELLSFTFGYTVTYTDDTTDTSSVNYSKNDAPCNGYRGHLLRFDKGVKKFRIDEIVGTGYTDTSETDTFTYTFAKNQSDGKRYFIVETAFDMSLEGEDVYEVNCDIGGRFDISFYNDGNEPVEPETFGVTFIAEGNDLTPYNKTGLTGQVTLNDSDVPQDNVITVPSNKTWDNKWKYYTKVNGNWMPGSSYTRSEILGLTLSADTKFEAEFAALQQYHVVFNVNGYELQSEDVGSGGTVTCPTHAQVIAFDKFNPSTHEFNYPYNWFGNNGLGVKSEDEINDYPIDNNYTFEAELTLITPSNKVKVNFKNHLNELIIPEQEIDEGSYVTTLPTTSEINAKTNGLTYMGSWRLGSTSLNAEVFQDSDIMSHPINEDANFFARMSCCITFDYGEESSQNSDEVYVEYGTPFSEITFPTPETVENYQFTEWQGDTVSTVTENMTFVAQWEYVEPTPLHIPVRLFNKMTGSLSTNSGAQNFNLSFTQDNHSNFIDVDINDVNQQNYGDGILTVANNFSTVSISNVSGTYSGTFNFGMDSTSEYYYNLYYYTGSTYSDSDKVNPMAIPYTKATHYDGGYKIAVELKDDGGEQPTGYTVTFLKCDSTTVVRTDTNVPSGTKYGETTGYNFPIAEEVSTFNAGTGCLFGGAWNASPLSLNGIQANTTYTPVCSCAGNSYTINFAVKNDMTSSQQFNDFNIEELNYTLYQGSIQNSQTITNGGSVNHGQTRQIAINDADAYSEIELTSIKIKYDTAEEAITTLEINGFTDDNGYKATAQLYLNEQPYYSGGSNTSSYTFAQTQINGMVLTIVVTKEETEL